jgi:hypothetical protein
MRELTEPVADKSVASYDPADVKVCREALGKAHPTVR